MKEEMLQAEDDEISECSDVEDTGYADFTKSDLEPYISLIEDMELKPTTNKKIKKLFSNHKQVTSDTSFGKTATPTPSP